MKLISTDFLTEKDQCPENLLFQRRKIAKSQRRKSKNQVLMQLSVSKPFKNQKCSHEIQGKST